MTLQLEKLSKKDLILLLTNVHYKLTFLESNAEENALAFVNERPEYRDYRDKNTYMLGWYTGSVKGIAEDIENHYIPFSLKELK